METRTRALLGVLALAGGAWYAWPDAPPDRTAAAAGAAAGPAAATAAPADSGARQWFTDVPASAGDSPASAQDKPFQVDPVLEAHQTARMLAAYREEAQVRMPRLRADIARARAQGLGEEHIARLEAKLRKMEKLSAMADAMPVEGSAPAR